MAENNKRKSNVDYDHKILEVRNLKKYFRVGSGKNRLVVPAVDNVSFDIYKREVFGLVGESGSGKTTTGRTIIKLYNPTEGTVKLNDFLVSAGYMEYVKNIREIKEKLRKDLISLEPFKVEIEKIKEKSRKDIIKLEMKIENNKNQYKEEYNELESEILLFKANKYQLTEQYKLDLDSLNYNFQLEVDKIQENTKNRALEEYKEEIKIQKTKFNNKYEGLKESAALTDEEIKKRIEELKIENEEELQHLETKFKSLIVEGEKNVIDKDTSKEQIRVLKEKLVADKVNLKTKFTEDQNNLVEPDFDKFKLDAKELKNKYKELNAEIKQQIKEIKTKAKLEIAEIKKSAKDNTLSSEDKANLKEKIKMLKKSANEKIVVEKEKIAASKQVNKSKEALQASRMMQMIFQDPISSLNPRMTVREIIGEGLIIAGNHTKEEINQKVEDILKIVGLAPEFAMRYPHEFSGGQRQRIGIARALIMNPNFIIADEPISALDVSIQAQVINLISELKDELDLTVLFIAHDLSVVRFFCDRVAVMHNGKIVELADTEELFKNPMHPYTVSLLSAIPQPDPDYEKGRKRIHYNPMMHDYRFDKPELREISEGHHVFANDKEFAEMQKQYAKNNKEVK